jgi:hypothetical protein
MRIEHAQTQEQQTKENLDQARLNHETVRSAKAEIGNVYHPYDQPFQGSTFTFSF